MSPTAEMAAPVPAEVTATEVTAAKVAAAMSAPSRGAGGSECRGTEGGERCKCEYRFAREHFDLLFVLSGCISRHVDWSAGRQGTFTKVPAAGAHSVFS
jgi:hypothetical protein